MKYDRFEDLPVWKSAIDLAVGTYALTKQRAFRGPGDLCSQLRRAALSVSNNIAEGFERGTTAELLTFLYIARGSAAEVRSMLCFVEQMMARSALQAAAQRDPAAHQDAQVPNPSSPIPDSQSQISNSKSQISNLKPLDESVLKSHVSIPQSCTGSYLNSQTSKANAKSALQGSLNPNTRDSFSDLNSQISNLKSLAESCSRQIRAWADKLQDSDIKGQRHLTESTRKAYESDRRADRYWKQLDEAMKAHMNRRTQEDDDK